MSEARLVLVTAGTREEGERIAHALVEERLAACVNLLGGMRSVYRWQGRIESADEVLLLIKTARTSLASLRQRVRALHSYETPEFLVLPVEEGDAPESDAYLAWLLASVG